MSITRAPLTGGDRDVLVGMLRELRQIVRWKLEGVDDEAASAVTTASGLHLHGLVSHLTNVERWWWRDVVGGQDGLAYDWTHDDEDGELHITGVAMTDLLDAYDAECARCDAVLDALDLDARSARKDYSVRWVVAHLVQETARHLGHIDVLREQVDGAAGDLPVEARR